MPKKPINITLGAVAAVNYNDSDGINRSGDAGCQGINATHTERPYPTSGLYVSPWDFAESDDKCVWIPVDDWLCGYQRVPDFPSAGINDFDCLRWDSTSEVCSNKYLQPGQFTRPQDFPAYFATPGGYQDQGCEETDYDGPGMDIIPTVLGATWGGYYTVLKTLTGGCQDAFGANVTYRDGAGNAIGGYNGSHVNTQYGAGSDVNIEKVRDYHHNIFLGLAGKYPGFFTVENVPQAYPYWIIGPGEWGAIGGTGACSRYEELHRQAVEGAGSHYWRRWLGCPAGMAEDPAAVTNIFGGVVSRVLDNYSIPTNYVVGWDNVNWAQSALTAPANAAQNNKGRCYRPVIHGPCPRHHTADGLGKCKGDRVGPACPPGYTFVGGNPANCVLSGDEYLYANYISSARGAMAQLGLASGRMLRAQTSPANPGFLVYRYGDSIPEWNDIAQSLRVNTTTDEDTSCPSMSRRRTGWWDIFYIRARGVVGSESYDVRYVYSPDNLRTIGGQTSDPFDTMTMTKVYCTLSGEYTVAAQNVIENTAYQKILHDYDDTNNFLVLLGYRDSAWYLRTGSINQSTRQVVLDAGERLLVSTDDYTIEQLERLGSREYRFTYYATDGKLRIISLSGIGPAGAGTIGSDSLLLDALASEYYSFAITKVDTWGALVGVFWKPNVLGPWTGASSRLGKFYTRVATWNGSAWTWGPERHITAIPDVTIGDGRLKKTVRGLELHFSSADVYKCNNLNIDGTGTWSKI